MRAVVDACGGDPACEAAIRKLFQQVYDAPTPIASNIWDANKCFDWLDGFLATQPGWVDGGTIELAEGRIVLEPKLVFTTDSKIIPTGWTFGFLVTGSMGSHGVVRVSITPEGGETSDDFYFDIGWFTNQGGYGGMDHWFYLQDPDYIPELDWINTAPYDRADI